MLAKDSRLRQPPARGPQSGASGEAFVNDGTFLRITSGYYAQDISGVLQQAAGEVWPGWGYGKFSQEAIWAATIDPGLTSGKAIVSMLPAWQTAITNYATSDGYQVNP